MLEARNITAEIGGTRILKDISVAFDPGEVAAMLGALMLVIADTAARTVLSPAEIPVGILTSLIGGPFFLCLLLRQYRGRS